MQKTRASLTREERTAMLLMRNKERTQRHQGVGSPQLHILKRNAWLFKKLTLMPSPPKGIDRVSHKQNTIKISRSHLKAIKIKNKPKCQLNKPCPLTHIRISVSLVLGMASCAHFTAGNAHPDSLVRSFLNELSTLS